MPLASGVMKNTQTSPVVPVRLTNPELLEQTRIVIADAKQLLRDTKKVLAENRRLRKELEKLIRHSNWDNARRQTPRKQKTRPR